MADQSTPMTMATDLIALFKEAQQTRETEEALVELTQTIAQTFGNQLQPGDSITLDSGAVYTESLTKVRATFLGLQVAGSGVDDQYLTRNGAHLENTDGVLSAKEVAELSDSRERNAVILSDRVRVATIEDRKAFIAEFPEVVRRFSELVVARHDAELPPTVTKAQRIVDGLS